ncbi:serine hydrolase domain-containing protein [Lewinella sp. IMCC34191]|uniref:serine hydrolase domain-containing protein n=1 Tax=Lewinella sp. IMCC34191 TaxID=2259172 RepID=UPI0013002009|nr:serine hydrolase domain-containing protein [Lewinella sp. IMCC34191]
MPRLALLLALFTLSKLLSAQSDMLIDAQDSTRLTPNQRTLVYEMLKQLPDGAEAGIALIDGELTTLYGVRREDGKLITTENADRHFGIGSVTKVFTATLLADLVEEGALFLDDPVPAAYDFPFADSITFTYRQLATHTSGLPRLPNNMPGLLLNPDDPYIDYSPTMIEAYLQEGLTVARDGNGGYSNLGFGLLGYTLGRYVDSVGYEAALQRRVLSPLGLADTHFGADSSTLMVPGLNEDGSSDVFWSFTEALGAAGALVSTPRDMAHFLRAQLDTAQPILAFTRQEQVKLNDHMSVALGWQILHPEPARTVHWHNGAVGGYRSFVAVDVEKQRGVVVLTNVLLLDDLVDRTGLQFLR